jgi:7-keto-8-aminopelargonate synthetase-like enzyme
MLDEAHATGLFGQNRRGLAEAFELADRVEISMGTLGKALGSAGGFICGSRALIDILVNRARSFIFSTAPLPAQSAAARAAIELVRSQEGEDRRAQLWARVDQVKNGLIGSSWKPPVPKSAIVPLLVGEETRAVRIAAALREAGLLIPAIRYPTVARGEARLRLTVTAGHISNDVATALHHLTHLAP